MNSRIQQLAFALILALSGGIYGSGAAAQYHDDHRGSRHDDRDHVCGYCGTVRSVTRISGHRRNNTGATVLGAVIGGALGNQVGSGDGRRAATVAGAVVGGAVAHNATRDNRDNRRRTYYRITVRMDNGRIRQYDQGSAGGLRAGTRVEIQDGRVYRAS